VLPVLGAGTASVGEASAALVGPSFGGDAAEGLRLLPRGAKMAERPMPESEASGARERTLALLFAQETGIGRSNGRARGLGWLQKSTSGAWSRSRDRGSSPLASGSRLVRGPGSAGESAPEAGLRWRKPRAREQRHRWRAPRDPMRRHASVLRARGREHSSMEGVLARRTSSSLTRRRQSRVQRLEAKGMRQRCRIRRGS